MKLLRKILFPFVPFYYIVVFLKNKFYDWSFLNSSFYDFPLICVGNLSVGGTGKSPMVEYLVSFLKNKYQLATLSRGYGRDSKGFIIADLKANSKIIGDEPLQLFNKFKDIIVAVDSDRQNGLTLLKKIKPSIEVVLLDDAFQHRNVSAGLNILLTAYDQLYCYDYVLPTGNLREPKSGAKRAHAIVVTKSPKSLSEDSKSSIVEQLNILPNQEVFFSSIQYADEIKSLTSTMSINELTGVRFTLVTGIANPAPLVIYLKSIGLDFDHLEFEDHHDFSKSERELIYSKPLILTTEKDFSRLISETSNNVYYLSIKLKIDRADVFEKLINTYVEQHIN
ncbi:tetraacyldisaccharide 4'-kinase [Flavobacteriaceae bacterium]|jgi:tetraacyldisaccharide 4'-kinase|nr:tetraacyldisaccharide 4'-kinase [Flavobacteriaceae bacterium]